MREIELTQGYKALVDDEDYDFVSQWKWYALKLKKRVYAVRSHGGPYMHRVIFLRFNDNIKNQIDHKDSNSLNNCRSNLRDATNGQNTSNAVKRPGTSSKFKGVSFSKSEQKYKAYINKDNKRINLGSFASETEAAIKYNEHAILLFGEFARLNIL